MVHIPPADCYIPAPLSQQGSTLIGHQDMVQIREESQWQHKPYEPVATMAEMERQGFFPGAPLDIWNRVMKCGIQNDFQLKPFDIIFPYKLDLKLPLHHSAFIQKVHDEFIDKALQVTHRADVQPFKQVLRVQLFPGRLPTVRNMQA